MQTVFLTPNYFPSIGGVETHVQKVAEQLVKRGHKLTIITMQTKDNQRLSEIVNSIEILRIPIHCNKQKKVTWQWIWQQRKQLIEADVVHVHDVGWWLLPVLPWVKNKLYLTFHGWEGQWPIRWQAKLHRLILAKLCKKTIHIGAWIKELYWDKPTLVLYGGVDGRKHHETKNQILTKHTKVLKIVYIGRLVKENDIALYCQLLTLFREKGISVRMQWLGDGAWKSECKKYGQVIGMVQNPEDYLVKADVVFASSYLSILLARSLGKPVWALYSNKLKQRYLETIPNQTGLIIDGNPHHLCDAVFDLKTSKWKAEAIARQYTNDWPPTWKEVATEYESLWQSQQNHEKHSF